MSDDKTPRVSVFEANEHRYRHVKECVCFRCRLVLDLRDCRAELARASDHAATLGLENERLRVEHYRESNWSNKENDIPSYCSCALCRIPKALLNDVDAHTVTDRLLPICLDCGMPGHNFPCDLVVPDDIWKIISPTGHEGGLLCPNCLCGRLAGLGMTSVQVGGDFSEIRKDDEGGGDSIGQVGCSWCKGSGEVKTIVGVRACYICDGTGSLAEGTRDQMGCAKCDGTGYIHLAAEQIAPCPACGDTRKTPKASPNGETASNSESEE